VKVPGEPAALARKNLEKLAASSNPTPPRISATVTSVSASSRLASSTTRLSMNRVAPTPIAWRG
jgi:hypothetical protein